MEKLSNHCHIPQAKGTLPNTGWNDCKRWRLREFAVRWWLLIIREIKLIESHWHYCPNVIWYLCQTESPEGLNATQRTVHNWRKLGMGGTVFLGKENTNWLSSFPKICPEKYIEIALYESSYNNKWTNEQNEQVIFRNTCTYTYAYIHTITFGEKLLVNLKKNGYMVRGKVRREEREGENVIKL